MTNLHTDEPFYLTTVVVGLTGVSAKTITAYETSGLIRIRRNSNGDRLFTAQDVERIKQIRKMRQEQNGKVWHRLMQTALKDQSLTRGDDRALLDLEPIESAAQQSNEPRSDSKGPADLVRG